MDEKRRGNLSKNWFSFVSKKNKPIVCLPGYEPIIQGDRLLLFTVKMLWSLAVDTAVLKTIMDKILEGIYKNLMEEMQVDETSLRLKEEILHLLKDSQSYLDQATYEKCRDMAFRAAGAGEEAGFYRGFRYAVQLFMECSQ